MLKGAKTMQEFIKKLRKVQNSLHVAKTQYNEFGKYMYRNQEDILEAAKPLLDEAGLLLYITDEIVHIEGRFYVKATVTVTDGTHQMQTSAYAREDLTKKGMDGSQVSGASSSYARKYALCGMMLLDGSRDADRLNKSTDYGAKQNAQNKKDIVRAIFEEAKREGMDAKGLKQVLQRYYNVNSSESLTIDQLQDLQMNYLEYWKELQKEGAESDMLESKPA